MNGVNKLLADEWGVKLMHVFAISPKMMTWEVWSYEPGNQPRRVEMSLPGVFPGVISGETLEHVPI